jgi:MFS family permease
MQMSGLHAPRPSLARENTPVRRFVVAWAFSCLGGGLIYPINAIYLHLHRHFSLASVGQSYAVTAAAVLTVTPLAGIANDRWGPHISIRAGLVLQAVGWAAIGAATNLSELLASAATIGLGTGLVMPSILPYLAEHTTPDQLPAALSSRYLATNIGVIPGFIVGGFLSSLTTGNILYLLYLANAVTYLVLIPVTVRRHRGAVPEGHRPMVRSVNPLQPLRDGRFRRLLLIHALIVMLGYAQLDSGMLLYGRIVLHIHPLSLALALAGNATVVVLAQRPVTRLTQSWHRSQLLLTMTCVWFAVSGASLSLTLLGKAATVAAFYLIMAGFGIVEVLFGLSIPVLVSQIAPKSRLASFESVCSISFSVGYIIGPVIGVSLVASDITASLWLAQLTAAALAFGAALFFRRGSLD